MIGIQVDGALYMGPIALLSGRAHEFSVLGFKEAIKN